MSYYGEELRDRIVIGWGANWQYAADTPTDEYRGMMTLARKLSLVDTPKGLRLSSAPYDTLGEIMVPTAIIKGEKAIESQVFGLGIEGYHNFAVTLSNGDDEELVFGVNENDEIFIDRSRAGDKTFCDIFASAVFGKVEKKRLYRGAITMEAIFDVSMLEMFADKGTFACAQVVYPTKPYNRIAIEGKAEVTYYDVIL